jgi:hypothetical protein
VRSLKKLTFATPKELMGVYILIMVCTICL